MCSMQPKLASDEELREYHPFVCGVKYTFVEHIILLPLFRNSALTQEGSERSIGLGIDGENINHICGAYKTVLKLDCEV